VVPQVLNLLELLYFLYYPENPVVQLALKLLELLDVLYYPENPVVQQVLLLLLVLMNLVPLYYLVLLTVL
jgi:hypothetical protein